VRPVTRGSGRFAKALVGAAAGAAALTTVADVLVRQAERRALTDEPKRLNGASRVDDSPAPPPSTARKVAAIGGVAAIAAGGVAVTTAWASATTPERLWERRLIGPLGNGSMAIAAAVVGWDFLYYWNHRFMHISRYMWAVHEVHHSSERYNLSTALRQPVADVLGTSVPYGLLCLFGIPPSAVATARGVNLIYQFWIHTEAIDRIGRAEATLNSASHHRVHHGTNRQYLDRNQGGILIVWDRMFGTFEPEDEHVVYGLTTNIDTFNPARIASHEYRDMARDIASSTGWTERLSYVFRGPGWATRQRQLAA
jgi:sterol desaturase/sphingolipid hydroxylase (fatty acid hydroxylase superfamily)